jgi:hypothetical protein
VFPGCDVPVAWCDAHHVHWWSRNGLTDIDQLALLCHHHHHQVTHRPAWTMHTTPDQRFWWEPPTGQVLHSQRHGRQDRERGTGADPPGDPAAGA